MKKAFKGINPQSGKEALEHMWVKIREIKDGKLFGALDNDPVFQMDLVCGSPVTVELTEIEDLGG